MATYEIAVTDVTCYGDLYCVAGWDLERERMIRPEPATTSAAEASKFWDRRFAGPGRAFSAGNVVRFRASPPPVGFQFPHATEDRIVEAGNRIEIVRRLAPSELLAEVAASRSVTLNDAFDDGLVRANSGKAYVPSGHRGRSLGAIEIEPGQIEFFEESFQDKKPKLRAELTEDETIYNLSVTADGARTRWKRDGLVGLEEDQRTSDRIHLRVGLSRPFPAMPNQCYVQINGAFFISD